MNSIAMQIDYATDIMRATNDLLEARANHRTLQNNGADIHKVIDAQVKVLKAELALAELYPAESEPMASDAEPLPDCGETFHKRPRIGGMHPDDPRKGQSDGINAMRRMK
jgi:hypothetical protein